MAKPVLIEVAKETYMNPRHNVYTVYVDGQYIGSHDELSCSEAYTNLDEQLQSLVDDYTKQGVEFKVEHIDLTLEVSA